ncbi:uncharacterized protein LOC111189860 isoform X3 [Astyanax mexicanus]|uniref:uncharacterized protein LOC111189860 isoform X2 n=1 Tax=Astyanax mexicanus TaxID=7994 RepID=UPI0020CAC38B|nr:uncharacterized protein LOC111189860 isoform X2 [Astyanax mexicanus]XP_049327285.1 uncharacterized protein LOC111189860 isoform X3 [Astyanax mexicanus]
MVQRDLREPKLFMMVFGNPLNSHLTFMNRLRQRLSYGEGTSIEESDVIIAFVAISSRAGTDIEAALQEIPQGLAQSIFLVVLHHTFDENWVIPDSRRSVNRRNVFTVDCLFHEDLGFLRCQSNDKALRAVTDHLIFLGVSERSTGDPGRETRRRTQVQPEADGIPERPKPFPRWIAKLLVGIGGVAVASAVVCFIYFLVNPK